MGTRDRAKLLKAFRGNNCLAKYIIELQHHGVVSLPETDTTYDIILDDGISVCFIKVDIDECSCYCPISV